MKKQGEKMTGLWHEKEVTIELMEPMLGTVPKNPEIYAMFIESKKPEDIQDGEV